MSIDAIIDARLSHIGRHYTYTVNILCHFRRIYRINIGPSHKVIKADDVAISKLQK